MRRRRSGLTGRPAGRTLFDMSDIVRCLTCDTYATRPPTDARTPLDAAECTTCGAKQLVPVAFEVALLNKLDAILAAVVVLEGQ
jgi:hypothetical protein